MRAARMPRSPGPPPRARQTCHARPLGLVPDQDDLRARLPPSLPFVSLVPLGALGCGSGTGEEFRLYAEAVNSADTVAVVLSERTLDFNCRPDTVMIRRMFASSATNEPTWW